MQQLGPLQRKWVMTLRSHPERQMKGSLGRKQPGGSYRCCCLGQGGLIAGICEFDGISIFEINSDAAFSLEKNYVDIGLHGAIGEIKYPDNANELFEEPPSMADFNDSHNNEWGDWTDLSYMMEAVPELFFSKSV